MPATCQFENCEKPAPYASWEVRLCEEHMEKAMNLKFGFRTCDGSDDMECVTGHKLHCPGCDSHLTSLGLCPDCGKRYELPAYALMREE